MKKVSIEYAHIYTNNHIGDEQKFSIDILQNITKEFNIEDVSLVVMVDDYSFPDPSFDYVKFTGWLEEHGYRPEIVLRESQLILACDDVLSLIEDSKLKAQIIDYVKVKKYPCSLFVAAWYLVRLGCIKSNIFNSQSTAEKLINILPISFKPFEEKGFEIIRATKFATSVDLIENMYFEGRLVV